MTTSKTKRGHDFEMTHKVLSALPSLKRAQNLSSLFENLIHPLSSHIDIAKHYQAFIHVSFAKEFKGKVESNERLEFLGDTVLDLLISHELFSIYPKLNEGQLSKTRASLVNEEGLYELGKACELYRLIVFGQGGLHNKSSPKQRPLADVVEALLGSVYEKEGLGAARELLHALFARYKLETGEDYKALERLEQFDPKSTLQEKVVAIHNTLPEYVDVEIGHQFYKVDLLINKKKILTRKGNSKRKVQRELAKYALEEKLYR